MQKLPRIKESMYEASLREVHKNLPTYLYKNFLIYLKEFRLAKYPIAVIFFTYIYLFFPELKERVFDKNLWSDLPFAFDIDSIVDITDGNTKLNLKFNLVNGKCYVVKISKGTIGLDYDLLVENALADKCEYDEIYRWYEGLDIVHQTHFLLVNTAFNSQPAVVSIQEYIGCMLVDIFDYMYNEEDLVDLLILYPDLAQKFYGFAKITTQTYENRRLTMDLVGKKNVVFVFDEINGMGLKILDTESIVAYNRYGLIDSPDMINLSRKLNFLKRMVEVCESKGIGITNVEG